MESLALLVSLIVFPAMFGGPIALIVTFVRPLIRYRVLQILTSVIAFSSCLVGIYLIALRVSSGGTIIGVIGVSTGLISLLRIRRLSKFN
jgi:disulfide bond formation protein DsbB